jgi:cation transporter-like permease
LEPTQNLASAPPAIPRQFYCPVTRAIMVHPVTAPDGMSYERNAWRDWESRCIGPLRSPVTQAFLRRGRSVPNTVLRTLIREYPGTASELEEQERELADWEPKPSHNQQIIHAATIGSGAVTSLFCSTLWGVLSGFVVGEMTSTLDPAHLFGPEVRNYERGLAFAQRGAQVGAIYGAVIGTRILRGDDTNRYALERATRQVLGLYLGGFVGGVIGLALGGLSGPLACFTLEVCEMKPFHGESLQTARTLGCVGVLLGAVVALTVVSQEMEREAQRRPTARRVRP